MLETSVCQASKINHKLFENKKTTKLVVFFMLYNLIINLKYIQKQVEE